MDKQTETTRTPRRPYKPPVLTVYGDVEELTLGSGGAASDFPSTGSAFG